MCKHLQNNQKLKMDVSLTLKLSRKESNKTRNMKYVTFVPIGPKGCCYLGIIKVALKNKKITFTWFQMLFIP